MRIFSRKWSEDYANAAQALLFGIVHVTDFVGADWLGPLLIFMLTGCVGYALGWLSIKKADGPIVYGVIIHAIVNVASSFVNLILFT